MNSPSNWQSFRKNRHNKKKLCQFLATYLVNNISKYCTDSNAFVTVGAFSGDYKNCAVMCDSEKISAVKELYGVHEETDTRIWLHISKSVFHNFLVFSPDTDVYHIGLPIVQKFKKKVVVQLNMKFGDEKYLDMKKLLHALTNDMAFHQISPSEIPNLIQILFICSGCDYVSFISGFGKSYFSKTFLTILFFHIQRRAVRWNSHSRTFMYDTPSKLFCMLKKFRKFLYLMCHNPREIYTFFLSIDWLPLFHVH